jgi:uncharacterized protein (TIRG00374 family)
VDASSEGTAGTPPSDPTASTSPDAISDTASDEKPTYFTKGRILFLFVSAATLYALAPKLLDVFAETPNLTRLSWPWLVVMVVVEIGSFVCMWWLIRIALPDVSWFVAGSAQLSGTAVSKTVPGGAAVGAALQFRMLAASGVRTGTAGSTMAATSIISTGALFALPLVALVLALFGAPIPAGLSLVAWGGGFIFLLLVGLGTLIVTTDRPLQVVGGLVEDLTHRFADRVGRENPFRVERLFDERDRVKAELGERWGRALVASSGNWLLDYLVLVAALKAVGSDPRMSLVLLAYGAAAVLAMIPITPGGLGFVEAGLAGTLALAGVPASDALLATLAYRLVSYWMLLPAGLGAWILFRRRYGDPPDAKAPEWNRVVTPH